MFVVRLVPSMTSKEHGAQLHDGTTAAAPARAPRARTPETLILGVRATRTGYVSQSGPSASSRSPVCARVREGFAGEKV